MCLSWFSGDDSSPSVHQFHGCCCLGQIPPVLHQWVQCLTGAAKVNVLILKSLIRGAELIMEYPLSESIYFAIHRTEALLEYYSDDEHHHLDPFHLLGCCSSHGMGRVRLWAHEDLLHPGLHPWGQVALCTCRSDAPVEKFTNATIYCIVQPSIHTSIHTYIHIFILFLPLIWSRVAGAAA